jgi:iron(III) transport system substrate-binding protein
MKKALIVLCMLLAMTTVLFAAGGKEAAPAADGPSGKIMIYTSMYPDVIEAMDKTLEKVFPNIDIEFFYGGTGALQAKINAELQAGKLGCDLLMVAEPSYAHELKEKGLLAPIMIDKPENKFLFEYDKDGYWYPVRVSNMVLAYNPEKVKKTDIPNSLKDFASDKRVTGALSMSNPLTSGTAMASISGLRDKYGYEYYTALGNQKVMIESGSVSLTKLETGEAKVIMVLEESILKKRQEDKSKLEVIYPTDGTLVCPSPIMAIADQYSANKNLAAAKVVIEWFLSIEGQKNIVDSWMHSVLAAYPTPPYDAIPTREIMKNTIPINWENTFRQREEMRTRFQEAVTNRR